ncbi:hypothetical protein AAFF27_09465 [Xylophilus sp. GW821-FHT01B05]
MPPKASRRPWLLAMMSSAVAALVAACAPRREAPGEPGAQPTTGGPAPISQGPAPASNASTPRAYRQDGAAHIYALNAHRIYPGRLPPLLYAIGTLQIYLDANGRVTRLDWMRAPRHAPEVVAEIERTVRQASPFPVPARLGKVVYTDTWLWDKSGRFQLDTLTEGQE